MLVASAVALSVPAASATTSWSIVATPGLATNTGGFLSDATCPASTLCYAVGAIGTKSLVERWNGTSWTKLSSPNPTGAESTELYGVACASSSSCMAVGTYGTTSAGWKTLAIRWNGTSWQRVTTPNPTGASTAQLYSVRCSSSTSCLAVGSYAKGDTYKTLTERWDGAQWKTVASPNPTGSDSSELLSISCPAASSCMAVGYGRVNGVWKTLIEHWNGSTWTKLSSPSPSTTDSDLYGVTCASTTNCQAVGGYESGGVYKTLVEKWNGSTWTKITSPHPTGATQSELFSISCTSTTSCVAVGDYDKDGTFTLVERWDGSSWTIVASPNPSSSYSTFNAVKCRSTVGCFAVGTYDNGSVNATLVERRQ